MKSDFVTVLDLGSTKATCLAATTNEKGELKVLASVSVPCRGVKRGVLNDLDAAARSIDSAVRQIQQATGLEVTSLIVGLSGSHLEGMNAQGLKLIVPRNRQITRQDVMEVIAHSRSVVLPPDREQVQALPREFKIDGSRDVRRPIGMTGSKLEVVTYLVTGQISAMQNLEKAVQMAGRKVEQMVLSPLAAGLGVLTDEELEIGTAVVDFGAGKTDLAIFTNGSIAYSASLPIGASHVINDVSKLLKTSPEEAERLKNEHGSAYAAAVSEQETVQVNQIGQTQPRPMQRKVLAEIIESRVRELATMTNQYIEKSGFNALLPGGIVLTGGGSAIPGTDRLFEDNCKHLRVRVAKPAYEDDAGHAAAVGLARFALQCYDEITPASGAQAWKEKVRSLFSFMGR